MTVAVLLATCARHGITLTPEGDGIRVRGLREVREQLRGDIQRLKPELLKVLREAGCPGPTWQKDWRGQWVNLAGLHGGGDALPN